MATNSSHAEMSAEGLFSWPSEATLITVRLSPSREEMHHKLDRLLAGDDFHADQHRSIWLLIQSLTEAGLSADPIAISDAAASRGDFIGGPNYLMELLSDPVAKHLSDAAIDQAAKRVKEFSMLRSLQASLRQAAALCDSQDIPTVMGRIEDDLVNIRQMSGTSRNGPRHLSIFNDAIMARLQAKLDGEVVQNGISYGYPELDQLTGALTPETLVVIGARPSMGKTAFAINVMQNVAEGDTSVLFFSLEMTGASIAQRNLSKHSRVNYSEIKGADIQESSWARLLDSIEATSDSKLFIDDSPGLTMSEIRARSRAFVNKYPKSVVVVDYLQIIAAPAGGREKTAHVGETSSALKGLARELKIPVIALSQLNRSVESRTNKRPILSDLRESGQLEQDADIIIFLYRDEYYNPDTQDKGIAEAILAKNRDGETSTVKYIFEGGCMNFIEMGVRATVD